MKIELSIIVPMYNAKLYIKEMLDSVLDEADDSIEVVVVDDGSEDESYRICENYNDSRIRIFRQENKGAPAARNYGLSKANGKYVLFFDADDFFVKGVVKRILNEIKKADHDCYLGNFYRYDGKDSKMEYKNLDWVKSMYDYYMFAPCPNCKVFKKSVLLDNNILFENIRLSQDLNFYLKFLGISQDIKILNYPIYYYRYVNNSISHITNDRILDIGKSIDLAISFYAKHNVSSEHYSYAYLAGVKHTNYQLYKLKFVGEVNMIKELFPKIVKIWDKFYKKARLNIFSFVYIKKKWSCAFLQMFYRISVKKRIKELESAAGK